MSQSLRPTDTPLLDRHKQASLVIKLFALCDLSNAEMLNLLGRFFGSSARTYYFSLGDYRRAKANPPQCRPPSIL